MHEKLRIKSFIVSTLFFLIAMTGMLVFADRKAIVIANVAQDQVETDVSRPQDAASAGTQTNLLRFRQGEENTDYLCIPLQSGVVAENISMENHYMDKEMWIYIANTDESYYATEAVYGNIDKIESGSYEYVNDRVLIKFSLENVYECISLLEENKLYIEFVHPREIYEKIIVIDAYGGGETLGIQAEGITEKSITLDIAKRLKGMLDGSDIKVYYTRTEDVDIPVESRVELANAVGADMFISIRLNESEDATVYGTETLYNENYFIPGFGSIELADLVERNVVTGISGKGNGLFAAKATDMILAEAKVPVAVLQAGYATNNREAGLLRKEAYREQIAKGIYLAISDAYENYLKEE